MTSTLSSRAQVLRQNMPQMVAADMHGVSQPTISRIYWAVGHELEHCTGLSLRRLARTLNRYRTFELNVNGRTTSSRHPELHPPTRRNLTNLAQVE
ncbi:MAG: hypothetical protein R2722_01515 [Tessaracoccus sp.]